MPRLARQKVAARLHHSHTRPKDGLVLGNSCRRSNDRKGVATDWSASRPISAVGRIQQDSQKRPLSVVKTGPTSRKSLLDVYMEAMDSPSGYDAQLPKLDRAGRIAWRAQRVIQAAALTANERVANLRLCLF